MTTAFKSVKCVVVGDGTVGKTCMILSYSKDQFPQEYTPTVANNVDTSLTVDNQIIRLGIWDTAGQEEYDRLRATSYPLTVH